MQYTTDELKKEFNKGYNKALSDFINAFGMERGLPNTLRNGSPSEIINALLVIQNKLYKENKND